MNHPSQQSYDFGVADGPISFGDERPTLQPRSPNPTDSRQRPSPGWHTYTHPQTSPLYLSVPQTSQTNELWQRSFEFPLDNGSTQAYPPVHAWSNIPNQRDYLGPAGDAFQSSYELSPLYPVAGPGSEHDWTGQSSIHPQFPENAPPIDQTRYGYSYDGVHSAANEANWSAPAWGPQSDLMNQVPSQPTYSTCPAPVSSQNSYHQPMENVPIGAFTAEEIAAAYECTPTTQTYNGNTSVHESADNHNGKQGAAMTNDVDSSHHGGRLGRSNTARLQKQVEPKTSPSRSSNSKSFQPLSTRLLAPGPTFDKTLKPGDNCPPRKRQARTVEPPQLTLMTNFSPASMKFLDSRPDPRDVSKIPFSEVKTNLLIMGVFDNRLSMCYVHPVLSLNPDPVKQLEMCDVAEKAVEDCLAGRGNEIISLIQNSRRWTALLPRSTREKSNGFVTVGGWGECNDYAYGNIEKASLCVAAAALGAFTGTACRPVFDRDTYESVRTGAQKISAQPARCLPSGVHQTSLEELKKLSQVPPEWGNRNLPPIQIAGQWV